MGLFPEGVKWQDAAPKHSKKRQKELQRKEKQQEKLAKRLARKEHPPTGEPSEEMQPLDAVNPEYA